MAEASKNRRQKLLLRKDIQQNPNPSQIKINLEKQDSD